MILRKWGFFGVAGAALLVGCAGSGSGGGTATGGTATGGGAASAIVNLPDRPAFVQVGYATGQGRSLAATRASDFTAIVRRVVLNDQYGSVTNPLDPELVLPLAGYQFQTKNLNVSFTGQNSRLFESIPLDFLRFESGGGTIPTPSAFPISFPARVQTMPSRSTLIPIYVDDAIFTIDSTGAVVFNQALFTAINQPGGAAIKGFFNDYVSFDLTNLAPADRPLLSNGTPAGRIYFSGDNYAISDAGTAGLYEALTLNVAEPIEGTFGPPGTGGTPGGSAGHAGTFTLTVPNPTNVDPTVTMRTVALQGTWQDFTSVFTNISNFEVLSFPSSSDNNIQELVAIVRTGTNVTNLYYGYADLELGQFHLFPVKNIVNADITGELTGTVSSLTTLNGSSTASFQSARYGSYTFTGGAALPSGFKSSGRFTIFRK